MIWVWMGPLTAFLQGKAASTKALMEGWGPKTPQPGPYFVPELALAKGKENMGPWTLPGLSKLPQPHSSTLAKLCFGKVQEQT